MNSTPNTAVQIVIDWDKLVDFSLQLEQSGIQPGTIPDNEWQIIEQTVTKLIQEDDWGGILRLRSIFNSLYARDTVTGLTSLQLLDDHAIQAARNLGDKVELGHLLGSKGHNLHRQGYHQDAIKAFDESVQNYKEVNQDFDALKSYYMASLCYRALGKRDKAKDILHDVLMQIVPENLWRANPLQVMAWIIQDEGDLKKSGEFLREAVMLYRQTPNSDMLIVGALADLGEISDILGDVDEARAYFEESLMILTRHQGQYERQQARTLLKYCEFLIHQKDYANAMTLLNQADDKVSGYGHYYDLLWQIELAKALIYLLERNINYCLNKIRSVFRIRKHLGLSNIWLVQHVMKRFAKRVFG